MKVISTVLKLSMAVVTIALLPVSVRAFPPAPHHVISGIVRDQYGNPVNDPSALVILQTPGGVRLANSIQPGLAPGVNYHLEVPMDAGNTIDLYEANALRTAASYKMYVVLGGITNTPIQMLNGYSQLGKPGGQTRLDLFLGTDSNGDGLPDEWQYAILAALGLGPDLSQIGPNGRAYPGGMTYYGSFIAGTYPFDPSDALVMRFVAVNGDSPVLEFNAINGRTYTVLGSTDMKQWVPVSFQLPADGVSPATRANIYVSGVQTIQVQALQPTTGPKLRFFKLLVQ